MSANAIEVLNARFANREQEFVQSPYWDQREPEHRPPHDPDCAMINHRKVRAAECNCSRGTQWGQKDTRDPVYDAMWARHLEWCDRVWPAPAGTGWEVTPVSGAEVAD